MAEISVNDLLVELRDENKTLSKDLKYYHKCYHLLQKYRQLLIDFNNKCICGQNNDIKSGIGSLETQYKRTLRLKMQIKVELKDNSTVGNEDINKVNDSLDTRSDNNINEYQEIKFEDNESSDDYCVDESDLDIDSDDSYLISCLKRSTPKTKTLNTKVDTKSDESENKTNDKTIKKFVCDWSDCGKGFRDGFALRNHIRVNHTHEKPFQCPECEKSYGNKKHLTAHLKIHSNITYKCSFPECVFDSTSDWNLKLHQKTHESVRECKCEVEGCNKSFVHKSQLNKHMISHSTVRPFTCDWPGCESTFKTRRALADHQLRHQSTDSCGQRPEGSTKTKIQYKKNFICVWPNCGQGYRDNDRLKTHIRVRHTNEKPFKCCECEKCFADKKHLIVHQRTHLAVKPYQCCWPGCTFSATSSHGLKVHTDYVHEKKERIRNFICNQKDCGKRFISNSKLNSHIRQVHLNIRPFSCDWPGCESSYKTGQMLAQHKFVHTNNRSFVCEYTDCMKAFNTPKNLYNHRNEVHIKPYRCSWPECGQAFGNNRSFKAHLDGHTGVRPLSAHIRRRAKGFFNRPQDLVLNLTNN